MLSPILADAALNTWPFVVLLVGIASVITFISVLRLHPFLALVGAALLSGVIADKLPIDPKFPDKGKLVRAVELTAEGFGKTAGGIAIVIGMATIIGMALMESGAADKVVRRFLAVSGTKPAGISLAIVTSTYLLSIPIFFDSMFMLMIPIAVAMALRTGKDFVLYVMAICAGGIITHALTIPHPGPIYMADYLGIDVGLSIWVGIVAGILPMFAGWMGCRWLNSKFPVPLRETASLPLADARKMMDKPESELPGFVASLLPIVLPILLISLASVFEVAKQTHAKDTATWAATFIGLFGGADGFTSVKNVVDFIGNKNIALVIGTFLALRLLMKQRGLSLAKTTELMSAPLETAGVIILITAAGGSFGYMLTQAGVGDALAVWAKGQQGINLVMLGYLVAVVIRIAQGSATVAMQTTSAMFVALVPALTCHPIYLFLAIGFGATGYSWMNDSGFWVVSRLSGFTEKETLRTWTVLATIISIVGIIMTMILSKLIPLAG
jgi:gluconate:H+ symporter, GntP family